MPFAGRTRASAGHGTRVTQSKLGRGLLDRRANAGRHARRERCEGAPAKAAAAPLPWTSEEVTTPYTQQPTSTHGKVFFTLGGNDYVCSGTALLSGNKSVVWTAGHCVNEGPGDFATNWEFVPAYKDGSAPLGVYVADNLFTSNAWGKLGDFSYDFAAAVVGPSGSTALTDRVGGRGIAFNYNRSQTYISYGYPAAPPFNGERLWTCNSALQTSDNDGQPGDDGHRLRHDRRLQRRRLDRRQQPVLGELLRVRQPAQRDVRPVPGQRRAVVYNAAAAD